MKAERQHKEPQKADPIKTKREKSKLSFVDNRPQAVSQTKLIKSIQKKEKNINLPDSRGVTQMIRKRVFGKNDTVAITDIFYDKDDGKYYKGMNMTETPEAGVDISATEFNKLQEMKQKERSSQTLLLAKSSDSTYMRNPTKEEGDEKYKGEVYGTGEIITSDLPAIRLYAEGNMNHAIGLAKEMNPDRYKSFFNLVSNDMDNDIRSEVLVKATEYGTKENVRLRYGRRLDYSLVDHLKKAGQDSFNKGIDQWFRNGVQAKERGQDTMPKTSKKQKEAWSIGHGLENPYTPIDGYLENLSTALNEDNLEVSFGGRTGDIGREPTSNEKPNRRLYDLIQATFFWIPEGTNADNLKKLTDFVMNQQHKLKTGGKLRVVLTHKGDMTYDPDKLSNYMGVMNQLRTTPLSDKFRINLNLLARDGNGVKYSDKLNEIGLNPENKFLHTETKSGLEVQSDQDAVLEITKITD